MLVILRLLFRLARRVCPSVPLQGTLPNTLEVRRQRQRTDTLRRVVRYDEETFQKAWDFLASNSSDDEDDILVFFDVFLPPEKGRNTVTFEQSDCFSAVRPRRSSDIC